MLRNLFSLYIIFNLYLGSFVYLHERPTFTIKPVITYSENELSKLIHSEAKSGDLTDMLFIGSVVLNRVLHSKFPKNTHDVIFQPGQFDGAGNKNYIRSDLSDMAAVYLMRSPIRNYKVLFFYNPKTSTDITFINNINKKYNFVTATNGHIFIGLK